MKKHTKFAAYALAGFMAVSAINVPSVYAEEIPTETVVDTANNSATDTTTETPTDSTADSGTETPANSAKDESKTDTVKKASTAKKKYISVKKYKKNKKLYVKVSSAKAYKNPDTTKGKLVVAKKYKKATKLTVTGTTKYKGKSYYVVKSGKSVYLVQQSLLSKTKPKTTSSSNNSNSSAKPSSSKHYEYNDKGQKVATKDNGVPSNVINYAYDEFIRCNMPGVKPHNGDKCIGYKMVNGKKKNIYYNKANNKCYYIDWEGEKCYVMHKDIWDGMSDDDWDGPGFE